MEFLRLSSEGPFTVQLFNSQASAVSGESKEGERVEGFNATGEGQ